MRADKKVEALSSEPETEQIRDEKSRITRAKEEGIEKGIEIGLKQVAKKLLKIGYSVKMVSQATELNEEEVKKLQVDERE